MQEVQFLLYSFLMLLSKFNKVFGSLTSVPISNHMCRNSWCSESVLWSLRSFNHKFANIFLAPAI